MPKPSSNPPYKARSSIKPAGFTAAIPTIAKPPAGSAISHRPKPRNPMPARLDNTIAKVFIGAAWQGLGQENVQDGPGLEARMPAMPHSADAIARLRAIGWPD